MPLFYPESASNDNPSKYIVPEEGASKVNLGCLQWLTGLNLKSCSRGQLIY